MSHPAHGHNIPAFLPSAGSLARKLSLFVPLSASDRQALDSLTTTQTTFRAGTDIVSENMTLRSVFLLQEGMALSYRNLPNGSRQIMTLLISGDLCNPHMFLGTNMDHSIGALTSVRVAALSRQGLMEALATRPRVSAAMSWSFLQEEAMLRERIVSLGRRDARGRIAYLLCELLWRHDAIGLAKGAAYHLPLTQTELGNAIGLTPVHVNRVLREFREQQLIAIEHKLLRVLDVVRLQNIAAFDKSYLHFDGASANVIEYLDRLEGRQARDEMRLSEAI